jgi:ribonuclease P protein component
MNDISFHDCSLPKQEILRKRNEIQNCFNKGITWQGKHLRVIYLKAEQRKAGFIVAKRYGKAVLRNRVKRLLREVYRNQKHQINDYHVVLSPKRDTTNIKIEDFRSDFTRFLETLKETR